MPSPESSVRISVTGRPLLQLGLSFFHTWDKFSDRVFEGPPNTTIALADSLGENARWSGIMGGVFLVSG